METKRSKQKEIKKITTMTGTTTRGGRKATWDQFLPVCGTKSPKRETRGTCRGRRVPLNYPAHLAELCAQRAHFYNASVAMRPRTAPTETARSIFFSLRLAWTKWFDKSSVNIKRSSGTVSAIQERSYECDDRFTLSIFWKCFQLPTGRIKSGAAWESWNGMNSGIVSERMLLPFWCSKGQCFRFAQHVQWILRQFRCSCV